MRAGRRQEPADRADVKEPMALALRVPLTATMTWQTRPPAARAVNVRGERPWPRIDHRAMACSGAAPMARSAAPKAHDDLMSGEVARGVVVRASPWRRPLRVDVERIQRLARGHEEAVTLGTSEAEVAADLGQPDAADELAFRRPDGHAAVAERTAARRAVARHPDVAVDVAASSVGAALDAVDHEVAEQLLIGQLVVGADVEHVHVALAAWSRVAWSWARADDVQLLVVGGEHEAVRVGKLILAEDEVESPARIRSVHVGRQLSLHRSNLRRLAEPRLTFAPPVARPAGRVGRAFVELTSVRRIREPVAAVGVRDDVVRRVEALAVVRVRDDRHRAVVLVADNATG